MNIQLPTRHSPLDFKRYLKLPDQNQTLNFTHSPSLLLPLPPRTPSQQIPSSSSSGQSLWSPSWCLFHIPCQQILLVLLSKQTLNFLNVLLLSSGPNYQHPLNGQLQQHPNQSLQFILHTHSSQNDPFKNQVSLYPTPSLGFLLQGDTHHGLLISLPRLTLSLTTFPFTHSFTQAPIVSHIKQACCSLRTFAPLPGMHFY